MEENEENEEKRGKMGKRKKKKEKERKRSRTRVCGFEVFEEFVKARVIGTVCLIPSKEIRLNSFSENHLKKEIKWHEKDALKKGIPNKRSSFI